MLKHCQATASDQTRRSRRNLSCHLNSNNNNKINTDNSSMASGSSTTGNYFVNSESSGPQDFRRSSLYSSHDQPFSMASRASSFASLNLTNVDSKMTPIKIYSRCLRSDIEYKTLSVSHRTTSTEVIWMLLSKYKMRHRDPKLFYLTMEIGVSSNLSPNTFAGLDNSLPNENNNSRMLVLDDDARPADLKSCYPWGDCRFTLQMRKGGLVRIHDSVLMAESKYKCLLISDQTTVREVINILFHCYGLERIERVDRFCMVEVFNDDPPKTRRLHPEDCPALVQSAWASPSECQFVLKRDLKPQHQLALNIPMNVSSPMSTSAASTSSSVSAASERSLGSCYEHMMDESEVSMDTSYSNTSSSSSSSSSDSPVPPPTSPERRLEPAPRVTINQSVQTSVVRNGLHLCNNKNISSLDRCSSVDGPPRSLPCVMKKNQMSQTSCHYLPLVHKPLPKPMQQHKQDQQQPKTNFNLNIPVTSMPPGLLCHQQQQQLITSRMVFNGPVTSIHESGLPPPPPRPTQATRLLLSTASCQPQQTQSLLTMGPGNRRPVISFHDYENYFYI